MKVSLSQIKSWFKKGMYPTESQFANTFDSFWHKDDTLPLSAIQNLMQILNDKAAAKHTHTLSDISDLSVLEQDISHQLASKASLTHRHDVSDIDNLDASVGEDITTNITCGALPAGSTISKDTTLGELVKKITTKLLNATKKLSPSCTLSNNGTTTGTYEVGTTVNPNLSLSFSDGSFNSYENSTSTTTKIDAGCSADGYRFRRGGSSWTTAHEQQDNTYTDSYELPEGITTYYAGIHHTESTNVAKNSDGGNSSISFDDEWLSDKSITYTAKYKYYCAAVDTIPDADDIRTAFDNNTNSGWADTNSVIEKQMTTLKMVLAIPATMQLDSAMTSNNENVLTGFESGLSSIVLKDAGDNDVDYKLYVLSTASQMSFTVTLKIK